MLRSLGAVADAAGFTFPLPSHERMAGDVEGLREGLVRDLEYQAGVRARPVSDLAKRVVPKLPRDPE